MKKIECIVRPGCLDELIVVVEKFGITGLNVTQVAGYGSQKGSKKTYRGVEYDVKLKEKLKIEIVVEEEQVEELLDSIIEVARTDTVGDGKIFISPVEEAVRVRTGERGTEAI
ncbi:P-II family nitrogen regulator [Fuchsiella alkaliacetigena]|uniref:P-II family nitrogen regulator n=1 Tax=Fuchsiella alkaliacetigena TaxID=957042 RepID=UPI00200B1A9E|nr:P-II family nitrogen regulator [Fuchsiella alkaliacetigena]MCK8825670.1 P-II family nitrogen regulator [Fuchsiella alkaliacetigena]